MQVNLAKLRGKIVERGYTHERLAREMHIDKSTLSRKMTSGGEDFTIGEMHKICRILGLSSEEATEIFLP